MMIDTQLAQTFAAARVLVTGGAGFIASHLIEALISCGADVTVVDSRLTPHDPPLEHGWQPIRYRRGTPGSTQLHVHAIAVGTEVFHRFLQNEPPFDYIFHLAARAYAAASVDTPRLDFTTNLVATVDLLEQLRALGGHSKLVFASSAAVYGNPTRLPIHENDLTVPISPYGVSKLAAERYLAVYAQLYGIPAASLRLFSVYGPRQRKQVVYDLFHKLQRSPDELVVIGDGSQMRDLVYVEDVVCAFLTVAARGRMDGSTYNVASGVGTSTADLARMIIDVQDADARITFTERTRPGDPERWIGAAPSLDVIGGAPRVMLREGLQATAQWFNAAVGMEKEWAA